MNQAAPVPPPTPADLAAEAALARAWAPPRGWRAAAAVHHRAMGRRLMLAALGAMLAAGALALAMRAQLALPGTGLLGPFAYDQIFTLHGGAMVFLFALPAMLGATLWLLPPLIGARDLPFPRLSAFAVWCVLFAGLILFGAAAFGVAPEAGWSMQPPLSVAARLGAGGSAWSAAVLLAQCASLALAVQIAVAVLRSRAPGMTPARMPVFAWCALAAAALLLLGVPALMLATAMLEMERVLGWPFFDPARGGAPLLWRRMFWLFGLPMTQAVLLPALGLLATLVPAHAGAPLAGRAWVVAAVLASAALALGLALHGAVAADAARPSLAIHATGGAVVLALPHAVLVCALVATIGRAESRPAPRTPLLFAAGFAVVFALGAATGAAAAFAPPGGWDMQGTQFTVAQLHYALAGAALFPLFGALHHWWPAATGRMPSEAWGRWSFALLFLGFNLAFFPLHLAGLAGMPRRVFTYPEGLGWTPANALASLGAALLATGVLVFLAGLLRAAWRGPRTGGNPWGAGTLDWLATPPPPFGLRAIPEVGTRDPLRDQPALALAVRRGEGLLGEAPRDGRRLALATSALEARPEVILTLPGRAWLPLATALCLAVLCLGWLLRLHPLAAGALGTVVAGLLWAWPGERDAAQPTALRAAPDLMLPAARGHHRAPGWTALQAALAADAAGFAALALVVLVLRAGAPAPPAGPTLLALAAVAASLGAAWWAEAAIRRGDRRRLVRRLLPALAAGAVALALQGWAVTSDVPPALHARDAAALLLMLYQGAHLALAMGLGALAAARARRGDFTAERHLALRVAVRVWSAAAAVWLAGAALLHLPSWMSAP